MARDDDEDKLLRSVALQNANAILTARQRAERELLEANEALEQKTEELAYSLAMMRATLESTTDGILVTDDSGQVITFNHRYVDLWGLPPAAMDSRDHRQLLDLCARQFKDAGRFRATIEEIYASSPPESFDVLELADGRVFERSSRIQCVDDKNVGRVWSFRDATESRRAEEVRFRLAAIVESSDDAIISKTLDGIITTWNIGAERMFGYRADEVIGKSITILIPPTSADEEPEILARLRRGERIEHYETVRMRKDGSFLDVALSVSPVKDGDGNIIGASKIARDITERKIAANEKEQLLDAERAARTEAERASLTKDEFLATLSHELRTPLSAILGWSQLLASGHMDAKEVKEGLATIERNARIQTQLIEDLLDMNRIVSGKVRLDVQRTDLADVVEAAVNSIRPAAEAKGIHLRKIIDPVAGPVAGDPGRLQQIVWNLLSNAVKFTPKGGKVEVLVERVNSHLEIAVNDSGLGIKSEFLPHVFERFRQADASTTRQFGGLGLGLSIVKQLVELHGGNVRATSAGEGLGAAFIVSLPLTAVRDVENREHPTSRNSSALECDFNLDELKVLVVDDEPDARALIKRVLLQCNAKVITAASAAEGLKILRSERPNVLISDIGMPEMDGYQFIRAVRKLSESDGGRTPAIALTAFARSEDRTRAMLAGYQVHISKPIEPQELIATVGSLAGQVPLPNRHQP
jgi:PAS domain S-box-containing protein